MVSQLTNKIDNLTQTVAVRMERIENRMARLEHRVDKALSVAVVAPAVDPRHNDSLASDTSLDDSSGSISERLVDARASLLVTNKYSWPPQPSVLERI